MAQRQKKLLWNPKKHSVAIFCNQRTRINMAWRDDCTKHKPKTGGMSTKIGPASSLSSTKRSRINPKRPGPQEARDKDSSDIRRFGGGVDQTFANQPPHPPGCAPRGHGTGIPTIWDDLMEATPKKTPVSSPKKTLNHNENFAQNRSTKFHFHQFSSTFVFIWRIRAPHLGNTGDKGRKKNIESRHSLTV